MVPKDNTDTWEYYKYQKNTYKLFHLGSLTADKKTRKRHLVFFPLLTYGLTLRFQERYITHADLLAHLTDLSGKFPREEDKKLLLLLLNLFIRAELQTTINKSRGQSDVVSSWTHQVTWINY